MISAASPSPSSSRRQATTKAVIDVKKKFWANPARKIIFVFLGLSALTIGLLILWLIIKVPPQLARAAGVGAPLRNWAWTDTVGWVSMNCRNNNACDTSDYNVGVDETSGKLDGYAWSDNVGWINFAVPFNEVPDTAFIANCGTGCQTAADACSACYNKQQRKFYGWARVESLKSTVSDLDNGWLRLDGGSYYSLTVRDYDPVNETPAGGETIWGDLLGWAWNGGSFSDGLGWFSFNCGNTNIVCPFYRVTGRPENPTIVKVEHPDGGDSHSLSVDWNYNNQAVYGASWYEVWRQNGVCQGGSRNGSHCDTNANCPGGTCQTEAFKRVKYQDGSDVKLDSASDEFTSRVYVDGAPTPPKIPLQLYVTYKYNVWSCNIFGCAKSNTVALSTSPIDQVKIFNATGICATGVAGQAYVDLDWYHPYYVVVSIDHYDIQYCRLDADQTISDCAPGDWLPLPPLSVNYDGSYSQQRYRDVLTTANGRYGDRFNWFVYRIRAVAANKTCVGGDNAGKVCSVDADCLPGGICDPNSPSKGSWAYSNALRICVAPSQYEETRPQ